MVRGEETDEQEGGGRRKEKMEVEIEVEVKVVAKWGVSEQGRRMGREGKEREGRFVPCE